MFGHKWQHLPSSLHAGKLHDLGSKEVLTDTIYCDWESTLEGASGGSSAGGRRGNPRNSTRCHLAKPASSESEACAFPGGNYHTL